MSAPDAYYDHAEFLAALELHAPEEYASLRRIAKGPASNDADAVTSRLGEWGIDVPWLRRAILGWIPNIREWGPKVGRPSLGGGPSEHNMVLRLSWEPANGEAREAFHARALRTLEAYERDVVGWAREHGIARAYERKREIPVGKDRWQVLVLHVVRGWPIERVAAHFRVDAEAVRKAIKAQARRLGFDISRRGKASARN